MTKGLPVSSEKENFEDILNELESIVGNLEKGDLPLSKSIEMFEKGISMYNNCKDFLGEAESKIKILTESLKEEEYEG